MNCERYKSALLDAAATTEKLGARLARHLESCPRCRTTLQSERELFSRIDSALRARVNENPRASFLAQVRVLLSRETSTDAGSNPMWPVTGAALALLLIATIYPLVNGRQPGAQGISPARGTAAPQSAGLIQSAHAVSKQSGMRPRAHFSRSAESKSATPQEPEVLVPPDEQQAFAQFVARVAGRDAMAEAVVSPAPDRVSVGNSELPEVPSIDIADLQREPLLLDEKQE